MRLNSGQWSSTWVDLEWFTNEELHKKDREFPASVTNGLE